MMGGHIDLDAPRQPILRVHHRDHRIDLLGRPGDHRLARRGIHRHRHLGIVGDQRLGGRRHPTPAAPSRPARPAATSTATGWRSPATPRPPLSAPATTAAVTSPIECPITASGCHPIGAPQLRSTPTAPPPTPAGSGRYRPPAHPTGQHLPQRKPHLLNKNRLQLGHRRGERRLIGQQLPAHPRPLRTLTRIHEHRPRTAHGPHARPPPPAPAAPPPAPATPPPPPAIPRTHRGETPHDRAR